MRYEPEPKERLLGRTTPFPADALRNRPEGGRGHLTCPQTSPTRELLSTFRAWTLGQPRHGHVYSLRNPSASCAATLLEAGDADACSSY